MKSIFKLVSVVILGTTNVMAQDAELSLICLSTDMSVPGIYHMSIYEDHPVGIPENSARTLFLSKQYYSLIQVIGQEGLIILGHNEFAVKATPSTLHPRAYKFKDLKNKMNYNCEVEQIATTQPGVIRIN